MSPADEETPLHNNNTIPVKATHSKNRVLVKKIHITRVGGSRDLAAFQLTPPLGRSIAPRWLLHHPFKRVKSINRYRNERCTQGCDAQISRMMREPGRLGRLGKGWTLSDDDAEGDDGWEVLQKVPIRIRSAKHSAPLLGRSKTLYMPI
jgi:hypothetical protein